MISQQKSFPDQTLIVSMTRTDAAKGQWQGLV